MTQKLTQKENNPVKKRDKTHKS